MTDDRMTLRGVGRAAARVIACWVFGIGLKFVPDADWRTHLAFIALMNAITADTEADTPSSVNENVKAKRGMGDR